MQLGLDGEWTTLGNLFQSLTAFMVQNIFQSTFQSLVGIQLEYFHMETKLAIYQNFNSKKFMVLILL